MRPVLLTVLGLLVALAVYGVAIEPRFLLDTKEVEAEVSGLPPEWNGRTVALLADFQVGMWLDNTGMVEEAVAEAAARRPALAIVAGDFVYKPDSARVREAAGYLRPLVEAGIPVVAVLGNHDYSLMTKDSERRPPMAEYLEAELRALGVTVLENDAAAVRIGDGDPLWVAGVGSVWAEAADVEAARAPLPPGAPRLWVMHNPEAFRRIPAGEAPLALAAHTHGGQIRILGPEESWLDIVRPGETVADGWASDEIGQAGNRLYVNRGIGFSGIPARVRCRPELTLVTLRPSGGTLPDRGP